jgi:peptidoglycan/LPS O-acetylase OafA/YrhL
VVAYRPDIDGLRAVAILAVLGFHALPRFVPGGFVGVDVFFVISGFLITSLIMEDLRAGQFSFLGFYERRVRRLFPALVVVLLATWLLGVLTLLPVELTALGKHILAAAAFAANILNFAEAGYFDAPAIAKPLLHMWSLGVEEQFYLLFPVLLVALWRYSRAWLLLALVGLASFVLNVATIHDHPDFSFYLPLTRFWEFVAGALLATGLRPAYAGRLSFPEALKPPFRNAMAIAGAGLIALSIAITTHQAFPGWKAILPVAGTAMLIAAGQGAWINRKVLANPTMVFIGLISYPLYLWHWPLIVTGRTIMRGMPNPHERTTALIAVALAVVLAIVTYRYIETPIRRRQGFFARPRTALLAGGLAATALLGLVTVQSQGFLFTYPPAVQALLGPQQVAEAAAGNAPNGAGPLVVTYGDSHSGHLLPGLSDLQRSRQFRLVSVRWHLCGPTGDVPVDSPACRDVTADNARQFESLKPDLVVIAAYWSRYKHHARLAQTVRALRDAGVRRVVIVGAVPTWPLPPQVLLYRHYQADPRAGIPVRLSGSNKAARDIDRQLREIASASGATFISALDALCDRDECLVRDGDAASDIIQADTNHFSVNGSRYFVRRIAAQLFDGAAPLTPPPAP